MLCQNTSFARHQYELVVSELLVDLDLYMIVVLKVQTSFLLCISLKPSTYGEVDETTATLKITI